MERSEMRGGNNHLLARDMFPMGLEHIRISPHALKTFHRGRTSDLDDEAKKQELLGRLAGAVHLRKKPRIPDLDKRKKRKGRRELFFQDAEDPNTFFIIEKGEANGSLTLDTVFRRLSPRILRY